MKVVVIVYDDNCKCLDTKIINTHSCHKTLVIFPTNINKESFSEGTAFDLPNKTTKKWKWVVGEVGKSFISTYFHTEKEIKEYYPNRDWYHKIQETEVEI